MTDTRRSSLARIAPTVGATLALLWLTSSTSAGAPLPWARHLPMELRLAPPAAPSTEPAAPEPALPHEPGFASPELRAAAGDPLARRPFGTEIRAAARRHEIDPLLIAAIVEVESNFAPDAVSPKGAIGLMQLMPVHFGGAELPFEPRVNLELGARYLNELSRRFDDLATTLAAYHAGPGAVDRAGGIAPYESTRRYVERVLSVYGRNRAEAAGVEPHTALARTAAGPRATTL